VNAYPITFEAVTLAFDTSDVTSDWLVSWAG
jgi:hypothetical protein